ncbi:M15 family metallopeptidase [Candidatus Parcubacteria bacterium]|nr:M15 family metallopeptidase [Candidatus Parcubacteria bacterium]
MTKTTYALLAGALLVAAAGAGYQWYDHATKLTHAHAVLAELGAALEVKTHENKELSEALQNEQQRNDAFEEQIDSISSEVGDLTKLSQIDPELLQKYSKVYFLNENYIPSELTQIPQEFIHDDDDEFFHKNAWRFLRDLMEEAAEDGIDITIVSGYRSFDTQRILKNGYQVTYGSGANTFSADQGYSEHQLGTAIDFSTKTLGGGLAGFDTTAAYAWLTENAHEYGFVLSYPPDNAYYQYEPWHWRFVGQKLADDLQDDDKRFYDLDQRDINEYLLTLFD